jgi:hypothetical protein
LSRQDSLAALNVIRVLFTGPDEGTLEDNDTRVGISIGGGRKCGGKEGFSLGKEQVAARGAQHGRMSNQPSNQSCFQAGRVD